MFTGFLEQMCERFGDGRFCGMADRFVAYEDEPVAITRVKARRPAAQLDVTFRVSKRSYVEVTVRAGDRVIATASRWLLRGGERFTFPRARRRAIRRRRGDEPHRRPLRARGAE